MSDITTIVGQRIRTRRQQLGYSQELASEKAGLHPTYIGQVERGEKNLTIKSIEKICIALDYPMEDLFYNIVITGKSNSAAERFHDLIIARPEDEQEELYLLLEDIIHYKQH